MLRRIANKVRFPGALVLTALALGGCGGNPDTGNESAGIDGTGIQPAAAYGRVTAFGSVWVNGVRFDTDNAAVFIDGEPGSLADIELGDVVTVRGTMDATADPDSTEATGRTVWLDHLLIAEITSLDIESGSFVALGQTVSVTDETAFDAAHAGGLASLAAGDFVTVSGFRNVAGEIAATRIGVQPIPAAESRTIGPITELVAGAQQFSINGLSVDTSTATWPAGSSSDLLRRDTVVEVRGTPGNPGELVATRIEIRPYYEPIPAGTRIEIEAFLTSFDATDPNRFTVGGTLEVDSADATIEGDVTYDTPIEVEGTLRADATVEAEYVRSLYTRPPGEHTVYGNVYQRSGSSVGKIAVGIFVTWRRDGEFGGGYYYGPLSTDASGQFTARGIPHDAQISIFAGHDGFAQPCAVIVDVNSDLNLDIELLSGTSLNSTNPPVPQASNGASLSGLVFETTEAGHEPIAGALLLAGDFLDVPIASTFSDATGHYFLCNLPAFTSLGANRSGYLSLDGDPWAYLGVIDTADSVTLDIELQRE